MKSLATVILLLSLALGGCPKPLPTTAIDEAITKPDSVRRDDADPCWRLVKRGRLAGTGNPDRDFDRLFESDASLLHRAVDVEGAGSVQTVLVGTTKIEDQSCSVLAVIAKANGQFEIATVAASSGSSPPSFHGVYDLAGCEQVLPVARLESGQRDAAEIRAGQRLGAMGAPAIAFWDGNTIYLYRLRDGGLHQVWRHRPYHSSSGGTTSTINEVLLKANDSGAMIAEWEDIYSPSGGDGEFDSPVAAAQDEVVLAAAERTALMGAAPTERSTLQLAELLGTEVQALREVKRLSWRHGGLDGWLLAVHGKAGNATLSATRFVTTTCGGFHASLAVALGEASGVRSAVPVVLSGSAKLFELTRLSSTPSLLEDAFPPTSGRDSRVLGRRSVDEGDEFDHGLLIETADHQWRLVTAKRGEIWRHAGAPLQRIEFVIGVGELPYLLADEQLFRFDGTRYAPVRAAAPK